MTFYSIDRDDWTTGDPERIQMIAGGFRKLGFGHIHTDEVGPELLRKAPASAPIIFIGHYMMMHWASDIYVRKAPTGFFAGVRLAYIMLRLFRSPYFGTRFSIGHETASIRRFVEQLTRK